jgi:hypothetical protein
LTGEESDKLAQAEKNVFVAKLKQYLFVKSWRFSSYPPAVGVRNEKEKRRP